MTDAYAAAGVDVAAADRGVAALVDVLKTIEPGRPSRVVPLPGHYASVLRLTDKLGLALGTGGYIPAWIAAWLPNVSFSIVALVMISKVR